MSKGSGNPAGRRPSSRNAKPYDANNSFVRKMATKVTDFIPQSSWISKWFNPLQDNEDALDSRENTEEVEDDTQQPPPNKRSRISMETIHPPGTFSIQTRAKSALNTFEPSKEQYPVNNEREDFSDLATAGPSGIGRLISSTPAMQADIRTVTSHKSDLNLASSINNGIINGIDDNSESSESTSGCSSLIPQINRHEGPSNLYNSTFPSRKRHIDDKLTFTNHLQSPRSLFLDSNSRDTLSSRRPSFNASVMTNVLDRASPLSSPFYSGNITFGGANAAGFYKQGRNLFNNSSELQLKVPRRTNIEVKPSNTEDDSSGMSQTAKKILEALEHFSSPISDAKKIPLKNTNNALLSGKKRSREEVSIPSARIGLRHLTRELTVPTVPDILKLRRRQKLQDTTLAARKIVSSRSDPPPPTQEYRLRMNDTDNEKYRGKLKGKSKINLEQEETVAPVNLPNVPLPITTLPNFNFTLPFPALHSAGKTIANKENTFTFASPIKMPDEKNEKNLQSVNNYTFSNPISADDSANKTIDSSSGSITENSGSAFSSIDGTTTSMPNFIWSGSSTAPRLKAKVKNSKDDIVELALAHEQNSGSVMNVLCSKSNKIESTLTEQSNSRLVSEMTHTDKIADESISTDTKNTLDATSFWECSECLIKNSGTNKQCTACRVTRPNPNDKTLSTCSTSTTVDTVVKSKPIADDCFGSQFKLSTNQWECTTCCVRNKQSDVKCVACSMLKPGSNADVVQQTVKSQNYDLMEKFKFAEGSWECHGCLLRNAANVITCPCCNASKPTSVKTNLKKTDTVTDSSSQKSSTIDIDNAAKQETTSSNYQIMNKFSKPTSVKTSSKKTDSVTESSPKKSDTADRDSTAMQGATSSNYEIMNKFKPSKDSWECPGCLVRNNNSIATCPCCSTSKPNSVGGSSNTRQTSTNGFGDKFKKPEGSWSCDSCLVQNDANQTQCVACQALKPGSVKSDKPASSTGSTLQFKFGIPSDTSSLTNQPSGFKFAIDKADNQSNSDTVSPLNGFKFGNLQPVICSTSTNATTTCLPTFAQPTFTFSDSKTSQSATIPTFGQVPTSTVALSTNLSFGENKLAKTSTPSSDKPTSDTPAATPAATLFPIVTSSTSLFNNNESKTTIAFGTDKPSAFATTVTESSKPSGFTIPEKIPTFGSNTQESKPSIFGTPEAKLPVFNSPTVNPLATFAIPSSSSVTPSLFGSSNNSTAFGNNSTPAFGGTTTTPATLFSSTKPSVEADPASNSSLFKFGSASSQQPATGSGFNFSANVNPATSSTKPLFTFGSNSTASPSSNNMFGSGTFGGNTASTNTNAGFAFNAPKQETPTAFGQSATATPLFAAPQANPQTQATSPSFSSTPLPSTGFNFASAAPPAAASGGFNFGGMSSTPTGGFNFNPPTSTPTVVFDPNSRPSFNFTKGSAPTSFNAPPQSAAPQRKIKKAFRRCMR